MRTNLYALGLASVAMIATVLLMATSAPAPTAVEYLEKDPRIQGLQGQRKGGSAARKSVRPGVRPEQMKQRNLPGQTAGRHIDQEQTRRGPAAQ